MFSYHLDIFNVIYSDLFYSRETVINLLNRFFANQKVDMINNEYYTIFFQKSGAILILKCNENDKSLHFVFLNIPESEYNSYTTHFIYYIYKNVITKYKFPIDFSYKCIVR